MRRVVSSPEPDTCPPQWDQLERLAKEGLAFLSAGDAADCVVLRAQLGDATPIELDYTGAGFFLTMRASPFSPALSRDGEIADVHATATNDADPLGFVLFVREGRAEMLEMFAYGYWPADLSDYKCRYVRWRRTSGTSAVAENAQTRDIASMWSALAD